jgi:effector-binding domain-containing protein
MSYDVHVKRVAPQPVVTARQHVVLAALGRAMHSTLATIALTVRPIDATQAAPFAIFYNEPFRPDDVDVEMGVPIAASATLDPSGRVRRRLQRGELPGGLVAFTFHVGSYQGIGAAYVAVYDWIVAHHHRPLGPPREIYLVCPGQGIEPAELRTEIDVPIA